MVEPMEGPGNVNEVQENPVDAQIENQEARADLIDVEAIAVPEPGLDDNQNNAAQDENKANDASISDITKRGLFLIEDMKQLVMLMHKRRQQGDAVLDSMPNTELFALAKRSAQSRSGKKSSKRLKRKLLH